MKVIHSLGTRFPRADTENFLEIALGRTSPWQFMWEPGNEHYAPLTRLYLALMTQWTRWDIPLTMFISISFFTVCLVFLIWCCKKKMQYWFPFSVVLTLFYYHPAQFEIWLSSCSYSPIMSVLVLSLGLFVLGDFFDSKKRFFFLIFILGVVFLAGPLVGGLLISGYVLVLGRQSLARFFQQISKNRNLGIYGTIFTLLFFIGLLYTILNVPSPSYHASFKATNVNDFISATWRLLNFSFFGYQDQFDVQKQEYILLALLGAILIFTVLIFYSSLRKMNLWRQIRSPHSELLDNLFPLVGPVALTVALAYGRANYTLESSRYFFMTNPLWICLFLFLYQNSRLKRVFINMFSSILIFLIGITFYASSGIPLRDVKAMHEIEQSVLSDIFDKNLSVDHVGLKYPLALGMRPQRFKEIFNLSKAHAFNIFSSQNPESNPVDLIPESLYFSSFDIVWEKMNGRDLNQTLVLPSNKPITAFSLLFRSEGSKSGTLRISLRANDKKHHVWSAEIPIENLTYGYRFSVFDIPTYRPRGDSYVLEIKVENNMDLMIGKTHRLNDGFANSMNIGMRGPVDQVIYGFAIAEH